MRYTESRMAPLASEMLADIDRETVDFQPNYKESTTEPTVLPAKAPNLLLNGTTGIGVGSGVSRSASACLMTFSPADTSTLCAAPSATAARTPAAVYPCSQPCPSIMHMASDGGV